MCASVCVFISISSWCSQFICVCVFMSNWGQQNSVCLKRKWRAALVISGIRHCSYQLKMKCRVWVETLIRGIKNQTTHWYGAKPYWFWRGKQKIHNPYFSKPHTHLPLSDQLRNLQRLQWLTAAVPAKKLGLILCAFTLNSGKCLYVIRQKQHVVCSPWQLWKRLLTMMLSYKNK